MKKIPITFSFSAGAVVALMVVSDIADAQKWPEERSVIFVAPAAVGGPSDLLARIAAERMRKSLGQSIVVENVAGAGGVVGANKVANAKPDGYTWLLANMGQSAAFALYNRTELDMRGRFEEVGVFVSTPLAIVVRKDLPVGNLNEFIALARKKQDKLNFAHAGVGSIAHLVGSYFNLLIDAKPTDIPYKGTGPALIDLISSKVDYLLDQTPSVTPHYKAKTVRVLVVASDERLPNMPDVPTSVEAGLPTFQVTAWNDIFLPRGTPFEIIKTIETALNEALADPKMQKIIINDLNAELPKIQLRSHAGLKKFVEDEAKRWRKVIEDSGIKGNL